MSKYRRVEGVDAAPMQNETVLFNPDTNKFCVLNETAAFVWEALQTARSAAELCDGVCEAFEGVDSATALADVEKVLDELETLELVAKDG